MPMCSDDPTCEENLTIKYRTREKKKLEKDKPKYAVSGA